MGVIMGIVIFFCVVIALVAYACCVVAGMSDAEIEIYTANNNDDFQDFENFEPLKSHIAYKGKTNDKG